MSNYIPKTMDLVLCEKVAEKAVREAGKLLLDYKDKFKIKVRKDDFDFATDADLDAEKLIIKIIRKNFPDHGIITEERGVIEKPSPFCWIIDPLDGTKEYARGIPDYTVNLTLEHQKEVVLGIVFRPETNQIFSAVKNKGARYNGKLLHTSPQNSFKQSVIYTHFPDFRMSKNKFDYTWQVLGSIAYNCYRLRGSAADILSLCFVAMGAAEGYVCITEKDRWIQKWWDVSAGFLMVEEAGGKITDIYGNRIKNRDTSNGIVASNGKIHGELLKYFKWKKLLQRPEFVTEDCPRYPTNGWNILNFARNFFERN